MRRNSILTFCTLVAVLSATFGRATPSAVAEDDGAAAEAVQARVSLPVRFEIDAVDKTVTAIALPAEIQSLDAAGQVVTTEPLASTLSTAAPISPDDAPPGCDPSRGDEPNFIGHEVQHASASKDKAFDLHYMFQTFQKDKARFLNGVERRQFMQCGAGGGRTFTNHEQVVNGSGSTMEDDTPVILPGGFKWGTGDEAKGVRATLGFKVEKAPLSITGSVDGIGGGDDYHGSQSSDEHADYLKAYRHNQVNGYWKPDFGGAVEAYKGNVHLALWEYRMDDTVNRVVKIRSQAWMVYQCGNPWRFLKKCGADANVATFDGPEITPREQVTKGEPVRWEVTVPRDGAKATTLKMKFGDGAEEARTIPMGQGLETFIFFHTFNGTGTYTQRATIVESGTSAEAGTLRVPGSAGGGSGDARGDGVGGGIWVGQFTVTTDQPQARGGDVGIVKGDGPYEQVRTYGLGTGMSNCWYDGAIILDVDSTGNDTSDSYNPYEIHIDYRALSTTALDRPETCAGASTRQPRDGTYTISYLNTGFGEFQGGNAFGWHHTFSSTEYAADSALQREYIRHCGLSGGWADKEELVVSGGVGAATVTIDAKVANDGRGIADLPGTESAICIQQKPGTHSGPPDGAQAPILVL